MATTTGAAAKTTTATATTKPFGKIELIDAVAKATKLEKTKVKAVIESTFETIEAQLKKKTGTNRVQLTGFGTFSVTKRKARTGVNPKTGEKIKIAARNVPKFTPGKALRDAVG